MKYVKNKQNRYLKIYKFATINGQLKILKVQNFSKSSYDMQKVVSCRALISPKIIGGHQMNLVSRGRFSCWNEKKMDPKKRIILNYSSVNE